MRSQATDIQAVEQFHLLFLAHLGARVDKKLYALKGGCNLRFFWKSIRYSQDIDFDVHTIAKGTLQKNVNRILKDPGFSRILTAHKLAIIQFSQPKQTDTTQRWKVHVRSGASAPLPTKVEFARRKFSRGLLFEPVDPEIVRAYNLRPTFASHYDLETAFAQKIEALIGRSETQARDIFDLAHLADRGATGARLKRDRKVLTMVRDNVLSVPFVQFKSQVVAFLPAEYGDYYGKEPTWETLQEKVINLLEGL